MPPDDGAEVGGQDGTLPPYADISLRSPENHMAFASEAHGNEPCAGGVLPWRAVEAVQNASSWAI